jgi:hypothetical protein
MGLNWVEKSKTGSFEKKGRKMSPFSLIVIFTCDFVRLKFFKMTTYSLFQIP